MSRSHSAIDRVVSTKSDKWTKIASRNPTRTIAALYLGPTGRTNSYGDAGEDFIFAMDAVRRIAETLSRSTLPQNPGEKREEGPSNEELKKNMEDLVNAGVVEALCRNVIELKGDTMTDEAMSSFYPPFVILYFIVIGMNAGNPLDDDEHEEKNPVNRRVLKEIVDNWEGMSDRWWQEPQNSLKQDATHEPERLLVSRLVGYLLLEDSSMYSKILHPSSNTLSLIARHWAFSISASVARLNLSILRSIIFFKFSQNVEEYLSEHERPSVVSLLKQVYKGICDPSMSNQYGPNVQTSPQQLLQTMSTRLALGDVSYAIEDLGFCHDIYAGLRESATVSSNASEFEEFADALRNSEAYWHNAFALMRVKDSDNSMHTEKELSVDVLNLALKLILQQPASEVAQVTKTWAKAGLFGVLDETMDDLVKIPGAPRLLTFFYTTIKESCLSPSFPPDILEALKDELPRQKAVAAVMRYESEQKSDKELDAIGDKTNDDDIPDAEDPIWINGLWQAMGWLQGACHRDHQGLERAQLGAEDKKLDTSLSPILCARRTCGNNAVSKCSSCKEFWYCGVECQKLDWKEHKPICKNNFAAPYMQTVRAGAKKLSGGTQARLGLIGLGPNDPNADSEKTGTVVDRLKSFSDYATPVTFLILVVAAQVFGIWDDLGRWIDTLLSKVSI